MIWKIICITLCSISSLYSMNTFLSKEDIDSSTRKRLRVDLPRPLEAFRARLRKDAKEHEAFKVESLGFIEFNEIDISEEEWQSASMILQVIQWPFQSIKSAVVSHLLFEAGADTPHQHLLRNALRPLLEEGNFDAQYEAVLPSLHQIFWRHPYLKKRVTLYAWAAAAHLQHPLARLGLIMAGQNLGAEAEKEWTLTDIREDFRDSLASEKMQKFISQNHLLIKLSLAQARSQLAQFISVSGIEEYVDLEGEELHDRLKLQRMSDFGFPHYAVLLAQSYIEPSKSLETYDQNTIEKILKLYKKAADDGDFEAGFLLHRKIYTILYLNMFFSEDKRQKMYFLADKYNELSAWQGFENAYFAIDKTRYEEEKTPALKVDILKEIRKIMTHKRIK